MKSKKLQYDVKNQTSVYFVELFLLMWYYKIKCKDVSRYENIVFTFK